MLDQFKKMAVFILAVILGWLGRFQPRRDRKEAAVIFFSGKLGDMVCLTPIFKAVKRQLGDGELIIYARKKFLPIWDNNPYLDRKIGFTGESEALRPGWLIKQWLFLRRYSIVSYYNLVNNFEGGVLGLAAPAARRKMVITKLDGRWLRLLHPYFTVSEYKFDRQIKEFYFEILSSDNIIVDDKKNQLFFPGGSALADNFWREHDLDNRFVVGLAVSSGKDYFKIWPAAYWAKLINLLKDGYQAKFVIFGLSGEAEIIETIGRQSGVDCLAVLDSELNQLPYYLNKCGLFVSVDMGVIYIADSLGVPVVDIIGPCDENTQRPENNYRLITNREVCPAYSKMLDSPTGHFDEMKRCYESITPEQVFDACRELIKN